MMAGDQCQGIPQDAVFMLAIVLCILVIIASIGGSVDTYIHKLRLLSELWLERRQQQQQQQQQQQIG